MSRRALEGMRAAVLGLGREGADLARFLATRGARVTISDLKGPEELRDRMEALTDLPIQYALGGHPDGLLEAELLVLSPGVAADAPIVGRARKRGIPVTSGTQLFLESCPCPVVGITGSCGKTTTTRLVGRMLEASGLKAHVGGNLGRPLLGDLAEIREEDVAVLELSSFQLELVERSPRVGAVLNVRPDHLNRHGSMAGYVEAKFNLLRFQGPQDWAVLNLDDQGSRALAPRCPGRIAFFSSTAEPSRGAFLRAGEVISRFEGVEEPVCAVEDIKLIGPHNVANVLAAVAVAVAAGADPRSLAGAIWEFRGVEHRLELVRELDGVSYYDDSIATSPERARAALRSFRLPLIMIAGGRGKGLPLDELASDIVERVRHLIVLGEAANDLVAAVEAGSAGRAGAALEAVSRANTLEEAVEMARQAARPGEVVVLSPAFVSFDMFRDFEERGARFRSLVGSL